MRLLAILAFQVITGVFTGTIGVSGGGTVATPADSNGGGCSGSSPTWTSCSGTVVVTLTDSTSGATICYRNDGTPPAATTPGTCDGGSTTYSGTFNLTTTTTVKALGTKVGLTNSSVLSSSYTFGGGLAPATTGRTQWLNWSVTTNLWQSFSPFATHPTNTQVASYVDNLDSLDAMLGNQTGGTQPTWVSSGINSLGSASFNGTSSKYSNVNRAYSSFVPTSSIITTSAFTYFIAFQANAHGVNVSPVYNNVSLTAQNGYFRWGVTQTYDGVNDTMNAYVYDGAFNVASVNFTLNAPHYIMVRLDGSGIHISLDGGSESTTASGAITSLPSDDYLIVGEDAFSASHFYSGMIGEMIFYNQALSGTDLTGTLAYFASRW